MIVTVTPNPALDVSYQVPVLRPGHTHRVAAVFERAGGKGLNVSRVLHELGAKTLAIAPIGGILGDSIRADLLDSSVPHELLPIATATRMTVTVVATDTAADTADDPAADDSAGLDEATVLNEPGAALDETDWTRLLALVKVHLDGARVLVCSGSLPPGVDPDAYADLVVLGHSRGCPVVVDTSGPALTLAAEAGADVVKPNAAELRAVLDVADPVAGAEELRARGAGAVVVSLGRAGMLAVTGEGRWRATPPRAVTGNPTGAGDAAVAALAHGIERDLPWPDRLRLAVAWSAAAVAAPTAGSVHRQVLDDIVERVAVERID